MLDTETGVHLSADDEQPATTATVLSHELMRMNVMTRINWAFCFLLVAILLACSPPDDAHAARCEALLGKWTWFTQGVVTFSPDGTMVHEPGNDGTWECSDPGQGLVTLRWREGGYVNHMALSPDGHALYSTDQSQSFVSARRVGDFQAASPAATAMVLTTQPDGGQALAENLPELLKQAAEPARSWRADAVPVSLEFEYLDAPNPTMKGPRVKVSFFSPSDGTGQVITVTSTGANTYTFNQRVTWGTLSLPPVFVDLPVAVRIARANGATGPIGAASLRVWSPAGAPPVLAWMVGGKTLEGTTGEIIDFDVTGYIASYNAQWEHAARGLRALFRAGRGRSGTFPVGYDGSGVPASGDAPYDDGSAGRAEYERNAAESRAYWGLDTEDYNRVKGGDCTWTDSSNGHC